MAALPDISVRRAELTALRGQRKLPLFSEGTLA
jgi:hypothetical protein